MAIMLLAGLSSGAQAAWESGTAGESTLSVSNGPNVLALAKSARVLAIGQDNNAGIALLNPDSGADIGSISLSTKPIGLALSDDGKVIYALLQGSTDVTVISATGSTLPQTIAIQANWPVGGKPVALLADQKQKRLYVADKEGRLLELNLDTGAVLRTLPINGKPVRLALVSGSPLVAGWHAERRYSDCRSHEPDSNQDHAHRFPNRWAAMVGYRFPCAGLAQEQGPMDAD
ncbi:hypothetical protein W01_14390 [Candidatus Nitrotoga sp. AM1P]|nr:hypothetical protein W01_14390 [Candidatus Nitrotoga sp. AM1P]